MAEADQVAEADQAARLSPGAGGAPLPVPGLAKATWLDRLVRGLALLAGAVLVLMVVLTITDVVLRYVFGAPLLGAQDLAELGLLVVVMLSLAHCGRTGGHIAIDVVVERLPRRLRRAIEGLTAALGALVMLLLAWRAGIAAERAADFGAGSSLLGIPLWPFHLLIGGGGGLYALVLIAQAARALGWRRGTA